MKAKTGIIQLFFFGILCIPVSLCAQNQNDVALSKEEQFQESYYESLKEKGLENYDKAITLLEKCLEMQPENAIIHHEIGRNYYFLKQYQNAEMSFLKATQIETKNKWFWIDLYEVYYQNKNYLAGIDILQKIIPLDSNYKEDLTAMYMYTKQYDKALVLINELDESFGKTERRDSYRLEINAQTRSMSTSTSELEKAIAKAPLNEENYLSLIYAYSDANQEQKAFEVAQKLQQNIPDSDWAQVFLFKYYLDNLQGDKAVKAIEKVFLSRKIDKKIKYKMYNQFLLFALKNPAYESQLNRATAYFENDPEFNVYTEIGKFYYKKKNWALAIKNLEIAYKKSNTDFETNVFLLAAYEETKEATKMYTTGLELTELFPNQPEYYYFSGKAAFLNQNFGKANELLETGLDYVIENVALEKDFLTALSEVAKAMGNQAKSEGYLSRISKLKR